MKTSIPLHALLALLGSVLICSPVLAADPWPIDGTATWAEPKDLTPWKNPYEPSKPREAQDVREHQQSAINRAETHREEKRNSQNDARRAFDRGLDKGLGSLKGWGDTAKAASNLYGALNAQDARLEANYQPTGAPAVPSKCMEIKNCRPCFEKAQGEVNKRRIALEKVRAHYEFTHRLTTTGVAFMQGVANQAGGIASIGAQVEAQEIDKSLAEFDQVVRRKNTEILGNLEKNLREVAVCEAKFYKNDDWFDRYGFTYYQFMLAHYDYVQVKK